MPEETKNLPVPSNNPSREVQRWTETQDDRWRDQYRINDINHEQWQDQQEVNERTNTRWEKLDNDIRAIKETYASDKRLATFVGKAILVGGRFLFYGLLGSGGWFAAHPDKVTAFFSSKPPDKP